AHARAARRHHRPGVADLPVRDRDRPRRTDLDPPGDPRGRDRGWRRLLAPAVPDRAAPAAARHIGGGAVRHGVHRDRSRRGLRADRWRAGELDPRAPTLAFQRGILGADLGQGAAIAVFLLPLLLVVAILMLRLARHTEVG